MNHRQTILVLGTAALVTLACGSSTDPVQGNQIPSLVGDWTVDEFYLNGDTLAPPSTGLLTLTTDSIHSTVVLGPTTGGSTSLVGSATYQQTVQTFKVGGSLRVIGSTNGTYHVVLDPIIPDTLHIHLAKPGTVVDLVAHR